MGARRIARSRLEAAASLFDVGSGRARARGRPRAPRGRALPRGRRAPCDGACLGRARPPEDGGGPPPRAGPRAPRSAPPSAEPERPGAAAYPDRVAGPDLRGREPEGRRRQDDDRDQPRRLPRRGRRALPARRPRPAGERDVGPRPTRQRALDARPARRRPARRARGRARSRTSTSSRRRPELAATTVQLSALAGGERYLADALRPEATDGYGFVFLDCPPAFGPLTVNALAAADRVIVPVQAEYYALEGLSQLLGSIDLVKRRLNPRLGVAGILLTMVDGAHAARRRGRARAAQPLRRPRLHDDRAPLGAPRRGAEPRPPCDRLRPPLRRRRGLLEGGDGACRAHLRPAPAPRPRPRPRGARRRRRRRAGAARTFRSTRSTRTRASRAAASSRRQPPGSPRRSGTRACSSRSSCGRARAGGYELIAGERRWRAAREAGLDTLPAARPRDRRPRDAAARARRERRPRGPLAGRGGARLRRARRRVRALAGRRRRARRALEAGVSNRLRLLELPEDVLWMLARGELTEGHARAVLAVPDDDGRRRLARRVARDGLTVRATEKRGAGGRGEAPAARRAGRPGARRAGARRRGAPDGPSGARLGGQARAPLRRRDAARGARRGPRGALAQRLPRCRSARSRDWPTRQLEGRHAGRSDRARGRARVCGREADAFRVVRRASGNLLGRFPPCAETWAILDSNQGPPPYQSGALTD